MQGAVSAVSFTPAVETDFTRNFALKGIGLLLGRFGHQVPFSQQVKCPLRVVFKARLANIMNGGRPNVARVQPFPFL